MASCMVSGLHHILLKCRVILVVLFIPGLLISLDVPTRACSVLGSQRTMSETSKCMELVLLVLSYRRDVRLKKHYFCISFFPFCSLPPSSSVLTFMFLIFAFSCFSSYASHLLFFISISTPV